MSWEETFQSWSRAPGQTEQDKCDNAVRAVRNAIDSEPSLRRRDIRVFAQGSYCNRTNVRQDTDVDVCVLCRESIFFDLPTGLSPAYFNISVPAIYGYPQFKNEVGAALTSYFLRGHITRGNKAFDIKENTYRIAADAVPCFVYKKFSLDGTAFDGVAFATDNGFRIVNWPEQNYENGVAKNSATGTRFKDVVRILKRLCYTMKDANLAAANPIPSFLLECLAFNVPDVTLRLSTYTATIRESLVHVYKDTQNAGTCSHWMEVNQRKPLFGDGQVWTFQQVNSFVLGAWSYWGFG